MKTNIQIAILFFVNFLFTSESFSQKTFTNRTFGFKIQIPDDWKNNYSEEFDTKLNESQNYWTIPSEGDYEILSDWDNCFGIAARANGYATDLSKVCLFERQRLHRKFDDLEVISENDSSLLVKTTIEGKAYKIMNYIRYKNGIGYVLSFSAQEPHFEKYIKKFTTILPAFTFTRVSVTYADLNTFIRKTPEDATLYYKRAYRKFSFHNFEGSIKDCDTAIQRFPLYGDAYHLRGILHISLQDTIAACRDFNSAMANDYPAESDLGTYCNTRRISEILANEQEEDENPFTDFDVNARHLDYVDSARNHPYIFLSGRGEMSPETIKILNHVNHLFMLDFAQIDSIYHHETGILKLYAFGIICQKFSNQFNAEHKKMLKTKGEVIVVSKEKKDAFSMPLKEVAAMMYQAIKEKEREYKAQIKVEKAIQSFIRRYAVFPDSYQSVSFEQFHVMRTIDGSTGETEKNSEDYIIGHRYQLKDKNGNVVTSYNTFKLTYDIKMNIIEGEESNTFSSFPPQIEEWLNQFGRKLSEKDKKELGIL